MKKFKTVDELINVIKPSDPVYCIRKNSIKKATKVFLQNFPGKILYAVKTNPHPFVVKTLIESGIKNFDVASIKEIEMIKKINKDLGCLIIVRPDQYVSQVLPLAHFDLLTEFFEKILCPAS